MAARSVARGVMDTTLGERFSRSVDCSNRHTSPGFCEEPLMRACCEKQYLVPPSETRCSPQSPSLHSPGLRTPCPTRPLSPEAVEVYTPCPKKSQQQAKKPGAYSIYKSNPHHVVIMDNRNEGELRFVGETELQQSLGDSHRYRHLAGKSMPGHSAALSPEDFMRRAGRNLPLSALQSPVVGAHLPDQEVWMQTGADNRFVQNPFDLRDKMLGPRNEYQAQPVYASLRDVPTQASSSWMLSSSECSSPAITHGSNLTTPSSAITGMDLSEEEITALSNYGNRASLQYVQPETIFLALGHDMKTYPSVDESEQLWRMGVQLGIGAGINAYRKVLGTSVVPDIALSSIPGALAQQAAKQDLTVAALAAQDIKASREMMADAVHSCGLDFHMLPEGGFPSANKLLEGPRMIDNGQVVKDPMPSMRAFYDATEPVGYIEGGRWIGGIDMTQLDGSARLAVQALRDHEMTESEMGLESTL